MGYLSMIERTDTVFPTVNPHLPPRSYETFKFFPDVAHGSYYVLC